MEKEAEKKEIYSQPEDPGKLLMNHIPIQSQKSTDNSFLFYAKISAFLLMNFLLAASIIFISIPAIPLKYTIHTAYRSYIRIVQQIFGSWLIIIASVYCPGSELVITGDWYKMRRGKRCVVISNHQIYPDWVYLWALAWSRGSHGDFKVFLMHFLSRLPLLGQGMWFFEFIFLKQRFEKDKQNIVDKLTLAKNDIKNPLWLLLFPEGTLNTPGNVSKSMAYASKNSIGKHPSHCILPKSTGLFFSCSTLYPTVKELFDVTVGYSGISASDIPYDSYRVGHVYGRGVYPLQIHMHVKKFSLGDVPGIQNGDRSLFDQWLFELWDEKDNLLDGFYKRGSFVDDKSSVVIHNMHVGGDEDESIIKDNEDVKNGKSPKWVLPLKAEVKDTLAVLAAIYFGFVFGGAYWKIIKLFAFVFFGMFAWLFGF